MTDTGIIRAIDDNNRITIPMELIKSLGWEKKERLKIVAFQRKILLSAAGSVDVGILRKLDSLGRLTVPQELCTDYQFSRREMLQFAYEGDTIYLIPVLQTCHFCGERGDKLEEHLGIPICSSCIEAIAYKRCI